MEIKQLSYFKLTAELEHMTRAADELMIAEPFLSKIISSLEAELGVKLFDRVGRQIRLNDYGMAFYRRVERIFAELEDAPRELNDIAQETEQTISVATNTSLYMPGLLSEFHNIAPKAILRQVSVRRRRMIQMMKAGEIDFAICSPAIEDAPELETVILLQEECPIIYPQDHWLKWRTAISLKDLEDESFISAAPGYGIRDSAEMFFHRAGISPSIIVESSDSAAIPNFVKSRLGIAFSPMTMVLQDPILRGCHLRITDPPCSSSVGLTWKRDRYQNRACVAFRSCATQFFDSLEGKGEK